MMIANSYKKSYQPLHFFNGFFTINGVPRYKWCKGMTTTFVCLYFTCCTVAPAKPKPTPTPKPSPTTPTNPWRPDLRCGKNFPVNGKPGQCNPKGQTPCCSPGGWCGNSVYHCECQGCIDYKPKKPGNVYLDNTVVLKWSVRSCLGIVLFYN